MGVEATNAPFFCPSCKSSHLPYPKERTKIVISDSTLHNFFAPPTPTTRDYEGDTLHTDYVTIPGAQLETLFHAFKLEYASHPRPMDIFIVGGYNDLVRKNSREYIMWHIKEFVRYVLELQNCPGSRNTIAVGTFMYPPQLAWFEDNGPEPDNYTNQKGKLNWLNRAIEDLNLENGAPDYVGIHKYGLRVVTRRRKDRYGQEHQRHIKKHRWEHWREKEKQNMLHLTNERRFKLGKAVNDFFICRTENHTAEN